MSHVWKEEKIGYSQEVVAKAKVNAGVALEEAAGKFDREFKVVHSHRK